METHFLLFDPKRKYRLKRPKNQPTVGTSIPHSENQVQLSNIVDDVSYFPKDIFPRIISQVTVFQVAMTGLESCCMGNCH